MRPVLDPWIEGYLDYQLKVRRLTPRSLVDVRCTLRRTVLMMEQIRPGVLLWQLTLEDYLQWLNRKREAGYSTQSINKELSHLRGLLDYTWRSGRCDRNVLDGLTLEDGSGSQVPAFLTIEQARQLI
jgi:site-specific recombinase XerD